MTDRNYQIGDYRPSEEAQHKAIKYWTERGRLDLVQMLADQIDQFIAHHKAHGKRMKDWESAWQTWYCNALKFNRQDPKSPKTTAGLLPEYRSKPQFPTPRTRPHLWWLQDRRLWQPDWKESEIPK